MSRRRRAVIATRLYTPEVTAASFRMEALAHALAADSDVTVLSTKPPRDTVVADAPGVVVRRAPVLRDRSGAIRGYVPYLSFDVPLFFRLLVRRSDVVVAEAPPTTGFAAAIAAFLTRRPLVYYPGDVWTDAVASMDAPVRWWRSCGSSSASSCAARRARWPSRTRSPSGSPRSAGDRSAS